MFLIKTINFGITTADIILIIGIVLFALSIVLFVFSFITYGANQSKNEVNNTGWKIELILGLVFFIAAVFLYFLFF